MKTLKNYLFESLIILTVLAAVVVFYFQFLHQKTAHNSQVSQTGLLVENKTVSNRATIPLESYKAPADLLSVEPEVILRLVGSNTIGDKLAPTLAAAYLQKIGADGTVKKPLATDNEYQVVGYVPYHDKVVAVEIKAHGSSTGFKALMADQADIAMSSRNIKHNENLELLLKQGDMTEPDSEHIIALDGLAVITHPDNSVKQLTVTELARIFSGEISNWSVLGGPNLAIKLYVRDDQSGTYDTFNSLVLKKHKKQLATATRFESNELLATGVTKDLGGIGFTGLAYAKEEMIVAVSAEKGLPAIKPKQFSISSEDYALSRRLFLYANKNRSKNLHVTDFIDFSVSNFGQQMAEVVGFVPQKVTTNLSKVNHQHPAKYQQMAMNGERLSVTFRMRADRAEIDNKSIQDIEHLVDYLNQTTYKKVALVAFSAKETGEQEDKNRAYIRTKLLAYELNQRGIKNIEIIALGNQLPIDSNDSDIGRYRNNRTEIWVTKVKKKS